MIRSRDSLISLKPVTVRREVFWGDCDPAGFVYTPRFGDYAAGAAQYFTSEILTDLRDPASGEPYGLPMKALSFEFKRFLRPNDVFFMKINVGNIRRHVFELLITASDESEREIFAAAMTRIVFDKRLGQSALIPSAARTTLEAYKRDVAA